MFFQNICDIMFTRIEWPLTFNIQNKPKSLRASGHLCQILWNFLKAFLTYCIKRDEHEVTVTLNYDLWPLVPKSNQLVHRARLTFVPILKIFPQDIPQISHHRWLNRHTDGWTTRKHNASSYGSCWCGCTKMTSSCFSMTHMLYLLFSG